MRNLHEWLSEYGESHQNKTNKLIHWFCVPIIMISIFGLLYCIPYFQDRDWMHNWGFIILIPILFFYFQLSKKIFFVFIVIGIGLLKFNEFLFHCLNYQIQSMLFLHIIIFSIAWIFQFYGHKIEGKKPSFLKDIQFLLIGPAWLLSFIFKKLNIEL